MGQKRVSVIVPVLNEIDTLCTREAALLALVAEADECVFVDGGSTDGSLEWMQQRFNSVLQSPKGRAVQMNTGASRAEGELLFFLHVDTECTPGVIPALRHSLAPWGYCRLSLSSSSWVFRVIERGIDWRARVTGVATGDQGLFVQRSVFEKVGGYPELALMEDVALSRRLRTLSWPTRIQEGLISAARRWEKHGVVRTVLTMWYLQLLFRLGVSDTQLAERYYGKHEK